MALTTYHHGITATETSNITPIMKSISTSTIALISTSADADDTAYPLDTPVLLTGITTTDVTNAGSDDQLLHQCLRTIKAIQNTSVVVLRLSEPVDVDTVDLLLSCQTSLGVTPKILIAPEIDTPAMTRKLVEIAKKRRAFVYASPRAEDGTLITVKEDIVAYRDTFAARELMLIEGGFGAPGKSKPSDGSGGGSDDVVEMSFVKLENVGKLDSETGVFVGNVYSVNGGPLELNRVDMTGQAMPVQTLICKPEGINNAFINYGNNQSVDWTAANMPDGLDTNYIYIFGMDIKMLNEFATFNGFELPPGVITEETTFELHPKTALSSADIEFDAYSAVIDPSMYTEADKAWFASRGISPAVKNPDGSVTLKSQVKLPSF